MENGCIRRPKRRLTLLTRRPSVLLAVSLGRIERRSRRRWRLREVRSRNGKIRRRSRGLLSWSRLHSSFVATWLVFHRLSLSSKVVPYSNLYLRYQELRRTSRTTL